jgi:hypothetical protein
MTRIAQYLADILASIHLAPPEPGKLIPLVVLDAALTGVPFARRATVIAELKHAKLI